MAHQLLHSAHNCRLRQHITLFSKNSYSPTLIPYRCLANLLPPSIKERKHTMNLSRVIIQLALSAALIASAVGSCEGTSSAWHAPPQKAFGARKNASKRRRSPQSVSTVAVNKKQQQAPSDNLLAAIHQDDENSKPRIIPASARAAAVAFVSAAAIGTTRHALERFVPCF